MRSRSWHPTALIAGAVYVVIGGLFLADRLDVLDVAVGWIWPILLIGLGAAVLAGGFAGRPDGEPADERPADEEDKPGAGEEPAPRAEEEPPQERPADAEPPAEAEPADEAVEERRQEE